MKYAITFIFLNLLSLGSVAQEVYSGAGVGYSEACRTKYAPGFAGGDCIAPNIDIRGLIGRQINDYFAIEGSLDFSFDPGHAVNALMDSLVSDGSDKHFYDPNLDEETQTNRWTITTLALHAFAQLPVTDSVRLFAGPSLGGSLVNFDYDVKYFGNGDYQSHSATEFGLNYGWAAGIDVLNHQQGFVRLQWQNWRSLEANVAHDGKFNSNTLTLNLVSYF